jgi:PIN domain nuclease of toxin-antitoxin system
MILLDTHILLWWQNEPSHLTSTYRTILDTTNDEIAISTISCWEIAMLVRKGRVTLPATYPEWMRTVIANSGLMLLDITFEVLEKLFSLPDAFHGDPADSIIAATSLAYDAQLATMDRKLVEYEFLSIL